MKNPVIRHKVCSYDGRLWVIDSVKDKRERSGERVVTMRMVDGDDVIFVDMQWSAYDLLNSSLVEQEFSLTPPSLVAALAADQEYSKWQRKPGSGGLVGQDRCVNCNFPLVAHTNSLCPAKAKPTPPPKPEEHGRWAGGQKAPPVRRPWETRRK